MSTVSNNKISFYPFLSVGVIAGVLLSMLISHAPNKEMSDLLPSKLAFTSLIDKFSFIWMSFYATMFLLAYPDKKSLFHLLWVTLIPSFFACLPFYWYSIYGCNGIFCTGSGAQFFLILLCAYAINAFQIHYQKNGFLLHYQTLFYAVWDTFAKLLIMLFFTLFCWMIIVLTASLFNFIGFRFISTLLLKNWFLVFSTTIYLSIGLYIATQTEMVACNVRNILLVMCRYLLIPLSVIGVFFMIGLLIHPINYTAGHDTAFSTIAFLSVLFLNGVYQDGTIEKPYPAFLLWILCVFIIMTPVLTAMAMHNYYFYSRHAVQSHGFDVSNFPYFFNLCLLLTYNIVYAVIALCRQKQWMKAIERANVLLAFVFIVSAFVTAYPAFVLQLPKPMNPYPYLRNAQQPIKTETTIDDGTWIAVKNNVIPTQARVLGYAKEPIYLCRASVNNQLYAGVVQLHRCAIIMNQKIVKAEVFSVYVEPMRKVFWSAYYPLGDQSRRLNVGFSPSNPVYICRVIHGNDIRVGFITNTIKFGLWTNTPNSALIAPYNF